MANQYLTVQQAQYLLEKWKSETVQKSGDTMTGKLILDAGLALGTAPKDTAPNFFLTLHESFADGGTVGWIAKTDMLSALGIGNSATDKNGSATNVSNNTDTTIGNTGALSAGTYILHAKCQFPTNTTGYRMLYLATSSTGGFIDRYARVIQAPASGTYTEIDLTYLTTISSNTTFYVRVKHTANTTLSCVGGIQFIKIH